MNYNRKMLLALGIALIIVLGFSQQNVVSAAASGQCYPSKPSYEYNDIVIIMINTPTGINDTKIVVYKPNGQVLSLNIGKVGIGVFQFPIGPTGPPPGRRTVVLMSGSTALFTTFYDVIEPSTPSPTITSQTLTQYQTFTMPTTVTQLATVKISEVNTETVVSVTTLPPPMDLVYFLFAVIVVLVAAILFLIVKILRS
jgi:hypothetical protein